MNNRKRDYLEENRNESIMTCGELKTLKFNMLDKDIETVKHIISNNKFATYKNTKSLSNMFNYLSIYKDTKSGNKELRSLGINSRSQTSVKIRPGARILKVETEREYREMIERYMHNDFNVSEDPSLVGKRKIHCLDLNNISKDYDGIYISKNVSKIVSKELSEYNSKNNFKPHESSRVIILNPDVLANPKDDKVTSYRKGVSGKIHNLSEENKQFSKFVYKSIPKYAQTRKVLNEYVNHNNYLIDEVYDDVSGKTKYYMNGKNITKTVNRLSDEFSNTNKALNKYHGELDLKINFDNPCADLYEKKVYLGISENYLAYSEYMVVHLKSSKVSENVKQDMLNNKAEIFSKVAKATILHELGHVNNNDRVKHYKARNELYANLKWDGETETFSVEKKYANKYLNEVLHAERLAWDYAFKENPNCRIQKWVATYCYSSYVYSNMSTKKSGYIYLDFKDGIRRPVRMI